jgi:hypothetical protein
MPFTVTGIEARFCMGYLFGSAQPSKFPISHLLLSYQSIWRSLPFYSISPATPLACACTCTWLTHKRSSALVLVKYFALLRSDKKVVYSSLASKSLNVSLPWHDTYATVERSLQFTDDRVAYPPIKFSFGNSKKTLGRARRRRRGNTDSSKISMSLVLIYFRFK